MGDCLEGSECPVPTVRTARAGGRTRDPPSEQRSLLMKALLAIDGSSESALALETAASLTWPAGAQLEILTVLPTEAEWYGGPWSVGVAYVPDADLRDRLRADRDALLERAAARLRRPASRFGPDRSRDVRRRSSWMWPKRSGPTSSSSAREVTARSNRHSSAPYLPRSLTRRIARSSSHDAPPLVGS